MRLLLLPTIVLCLVLIGCTGDKGVVSGWQLDQPSPTDVVPNTGFYEFVTDHTITGSFHGRLVFNVFIARQYSSLKPFVYFSADGYRYDWIPIEDGAFYWEHGQINGYDSPTDGYAISGQFVTPTRAEGIIKLAITGHIMAEATFVATLE